MLFRSLCIVALFSTYVNASGDGDRLYPDLSLPSFAPMSPTGFQVGPTNSSGVVYWSAAAAAGAAGAAAEAAVPSAPPATPSESMMDLASTAAEFPTIEEWTVLVDTLLDDDASYEAIVAFCAEHRQMLILSPELRQYLRSRLRYHLNRLWVQHALPMTVDAALDKLLPLLDTPSGRAFAEGESLEREFFALLDRQDVTFEDVVTFVSRNIVRLRAHPFVLHKVLKTMLRSIRKDESLVNKESFAEFLLSIGLVPADLRVGLITPLDLHKLGFTYAIIRALKIWKDVELGPLFADLVERELAELGVSAEDIVTLIRRQRDRINWEIMAEYFPLAHLVAAGAKLADISEFKRDLSPQNAEELGYSDLEILLHFSTGELVSCFWSARRLFKAGIARKELLKHFSKDQIDAANEGDK